MADLPTPDLKSSQGKKILLVVGVAGAGFVGFAWYRNRQAAAAAPADATATDGTYDSGYVTQASPGAAGGYAGNDTTDNTSADPGTAAPTTNAAWTQLAMTQLSQAGYDPATVAAALGKYLGRQPLSDAEQLVVRAALAVAGPPPVGTYVVIPSLPTPTPGGTTGGTAKPPTTTPPPVTTPKPPVSTAKPPAPKPTIPAYTTIYITPKNNSLAKAVAAYNAKYHTHHTWQEVWNFNLRYRSASTVKTLKARGPNKTYVGSSFWIPK